MIDNQEQQSPLEVHEAVIYYGTKETRRAIIQVLTAGIQDMLDLVRWPAAVRDFARSADELSARWDAQVENGHHPEGLPEFATFRTQLGVWRRLFDAKRPTLGVEALEQFEGELTALLTHLHGEKPSAKYVSGELRSLMQRAAEIPDAKHLEHAIKVLLDGQPSP